MVVCDTCPEAFHMKCLPVEYAISAKIDDREWKCPVCSQDCPPHVTGADAEAGAE